MADPVPADVPKLPDFTPGTVWLVGAGPGDPGLLTLYALKALKEADAIVHDALVDHRIIALAAPAATLHDAGKRGGRPSASQRDISDLLVELARAGKRVLRLKGGDPFVFGRGGEEALALAAAGIRYRIVPGITAGIGGLAYAGIPATHRQMSQAVTLLTGHDLAGDVPGSLDWAALARLPVLVCYMALRQLPGLTQRLIANGRSPYEPAALVSQATTPAQRVVVTTLGRVAAEAAGVEPPALLVVGEVVRLSTELAWLDGETGG